MKRTTPARRPAPTDVAGPAGGPDLGTLARAYTQQCRRRRDAPPHWVDALVRPLAEAAAAAFPRRRLELLGPQGLGSAVCVCLIRVEAAPEDRMRDAFCRSVTLVPVDLKRGRIGRRDYNRRLGRYPPGSLGALNGLDYAEEALPEDLTPGGLAALMTGRLWPDEDPAAR